MSGPKIVVARKSGSAALAKRIAGLTKHAAYVGIPSSTSRDRSAQLLGMASNAKAGSKKRRKLEKAAAEDVTNSELLYIFSKGSPARSQPARPVLEPAVAADGNRQAIAHELAEAAKFGLHGDAEKSMQRIRRASLAGQNAARKWFTDSRNNWAPNAPSTIARKGSDRPGIDTGAMRNAIIGIVGES
jgi:hypothetical protein